MPPGFDRISAKCQLAMKPSFCGGRIGRDVTHPGRDLCLHKALPSQVQTQLQASHIFKIEILTNCISYTQPDQNSSSFLSICASGTLTKSLTTKVLVWQELDEKQEAMRINLYTQGEGEIALAISGTIQNTLFFSVEIGELEFSNPLVNTPSVPFPPVCRHRVLLLLVAEQFSRAQLLSSVLFPWQPSDWCRQTRDLNCTPPEHRSVHIDHELQGSQPVRSVGYTNRTLK